MAAQLHQDCLQDCSLACLSGLTKRNMAEPSAWR